MTCIPMGPTRPNGVRQARDSNPRGEHISRAAVKSVFKSNQQDRGSNFALHGRDGDTVSAGVSWAKQGRTGGDVWESWAKYYQRCANDRGLVNSGEQRETITCHHAHVSQKCSNINRAFFECRTGAISTSQQQRRPSSGSNPTSKWKC